MPRSLLAAALAACAVAQTPPAFQRGWILAARVLNQGSSNAAEAGFIDVIDPVAKSVVYTYALPTAAAGASAACTFASSKSEGALTRAAPVPRGPPPPSHFCTLPLVQPHTPPRL